MKLIIQEYGLTLLAVLVSGALIFLCLHGSAGDSEAAESKGILSEALCHRNAQAGKSYGQQEDRRVCSSLMAQDAPLIVCHTYGIKRGQSIDWNRIFDARDCQGRMVPIRVLSVDGKKIADDFSFEKTGKYQVVVEAVDTYGKRSRQRFQLPVLPQIGMQEGEEL